MKIAAWTEHTTGSANAAATATKAAESNRTHIIHTILASLNAGSPAGAVLTVDLGTATFTFFVSAFNDGGVISIPGGLYAERGAAVSASLAAGGASVLGRVTLIGHTE